MAHTRFLGVAVMLVSVGSMAAAPPPAPAQTARIQVGPQTAVQPVSITHVGFVAGGYLVTIDNPTATVSPVELHFKGKTIPFESKSKAPVFINVPDPDSAALCNIGTLAFNLTGPKADTRIRHTEVVGNPVFNAKGGTLSGAAPVPGDTNGKVALLGGGATHWYGCGTKFEISALAANDTTVTPQHLKLDLFDVDGSKMGEVPANIAAKDKTSLSIGSTTNVSGRVGQIRAHLSDSSAELDGKVLSGRDLLIEITRAGGTTSLKLID